MGSFSEGVHKWMRELNVDVGFETKKMKMERTRMLSLEGYHRRLVVSINGGSTINVSPLVYSEPFVGLILYFGKG
jgi:hypothetical protein